MMGSLIRYLLASYTRSYRYFAPIAFMLISVVFLYSYRPNPIMDSYAVTAVFLFVGSAWLGLNFHNHDLGRQTMLLIVHSGKALRFYAAQYITVSLLSILFSAFAVLYPVMFGMFDKPITFSELALGYAGHVAMSLLGISLSVFFQFGFMENQGRAAGLLFIVIIVSLAGQSIVQFDHAYWGIIPYLLPPVSVMMDLFMHADERSPAVKLLTIAYSFIYGFILLAVYLWTASRKDAASMIRKVG
ncbi:hypothetical protein JNUCC32_05460 [Paenibacillus sp. JNUCC32]|uniref:hypothetical protein n=1 Tax=Paenibacillus sp. JNUCC32 TaxID=2777984 RepID=UPI001787C003|nr:hypothetical protein [Paenibacillus sp. JNUCC-32]QOT11475.1 hypothetical protein JNUCC32_05460 [Paenibacillus sp. JNUCC-32]